MRKQDPVATAPPPAALRSQAEILPGVTRAQVEAMSVAEVQALANELLVRKAELEVREEDLHRAQAELAWLASFPKLNPCPITSVELDGGIHYLNPAAERLFPDIRQRGIEHPWLADWELVAGRFRQGDTQSITRRVNVGERCYQQVIHLLPETGRVRIYGMDVTQQQRTEEQQAKERANLQAIFDVVNVGLLLIDRQGAVRRVNDTVSRWVGKDPTACSGLQPGDFVGCIHALANTDGCGHSPRCASCPVRNTFQSVLQSGQSIHDIEAQATLLIGGKEVSLWLEASADPLILDGEPHVVLALNNITARKQAEEALRNREQRGRLLSEVTSQLLASNRPQQIVESLCRRVMDYLGCHAFFNYLLDDESGRLRLNACAGVSEETVRQMQLLDQGTVCGCVAREGCRIVIEDVQTASEPNTGLIRSLGLQAYACNPLLNQGRVVGTLSFGTRTKTAFAEDELLLMKTVADHVAIAMQRKRHEESLHRIAADLRRSNSDLEQFAYVASHDLQEPLRMVAGFVHLLRQDYAGRLDPSADEYIQYAVDGAQRMQTLIDDLLAYSRAGTCKRELSPTDAGECLRKALDNLATAIRDSEACITHDNLPTVRADATQLVQLFQNLIANAIKFRSQAAPAIHIAAGRKDGHWRFSVRDNGIGIDPEYQDRIFLIFQRLHNHREYPGTGIGLAICKKIVDRHDGQIWVESQLGRGAAFHFTIPA